MHYSELLEAHKVFREEYPFEESYDQIMRLMRDKESLSLSDAEAVLRFLNQWRCRIPRKPEVCEAIMNAHNEIIFPAFSEPRHERLEFTDLKKTVEVGHNTKRLDWLIADTYDALLRVGYKIKDTAISKMLHVVSPGIFVMWDMNIRREYIGHTKGSGHEFAFIFLPRMKSEICEAVEHYGRDKGLSKGEAADALVKEGDGRSLAKLADEFNYTKYTGKRA